jgi:hypothetical protein
MCLPQMASHINSLVLKGRHIKTSSHIKPHQAQDVTTSNAHQAPH